MMDLGGNPSYEENVDEILDELAGLLDRLAHRQPVVQPGLDARNAFRRVIDAYLSERRQLNNPALRPLRTLTAEPLTAQHLALYNLRQAEELFVRIGDREGVALAVTNMGTVFASVAAFPEALECYARGLAIFGDLGNLRNASRCLTNIGIIQNALPSYMRALSVLTEALQLLPFAEQSVSASADNELTEVFELLHATVLTLEQYGPALSIVQR